MPGLTVSGRVEQVLSLRFSDLLALSPQIDDVSALVPGRAGAAVRLSTLLEKAGAQPAATHVVLISRDGAFTARVAIAEARNALIVYRLGQQPLPEKEGGPIRYLNPEAMTCEPGNKAACSNVKFLGSIELITAA
ncbi:MAG: molybdopterin-dependent oxidoreductase [Planctomycetes bacterium]|jgi:DMSO/TMAO reductase YedYZ molybdopterin-dependent catalytic subunit|nr:molybdopterin-dependent oxidoreductase [Planctomycetota bacterium]MCL4729906.1 molybdopterin-dependent oxidoreductase [Planctomycetota bacterium]